jgi:hypothetical protein
VSGATSIKLARAAASQTKRHTRQPRGLFFGWGALHTVVVQARAAVADRDVPTAEHKRRACLSRKPETCSQNGFGPRCLLLPGAALFAFWSLAPTAALQPAAPDPLLRVPGARFSGGPRLAANALVKVYQGSTRAFFRAVAPAAERPLDPRTALEPSARARRRLALRDSSCARMGAATAARAWRMGQ